MTVALGALALVAAITLWTAWEKSMAARLRADRRPLVARNVARLGAERLTALGQLGFVALVVAVTSITGLRWSTESAAVSPEVGTVVSGALVVAATVLLVLASRHRLRRRNAWALAAVVLSALGTELLLRGFVLAALASVPVTVSVLVAAVATGALQAWRASPGRVGEAAAWATVLGFVLGLVATVTGSVMAAVALHVAVSGLAYLRMLPPEGAVAGCACGGDHSDAGHSGPEQTTGAPASPATSGHAGPCDNACGHAGTDACTTCPLSSARVGRDALA